MANPEYKTIKLYESKQKERNIDLYGDHADSCVCCGKRTNEEKNNLYIHMTENWEAINVSDKVLEDLYNNNKYFSLTQGFFPVGKTCAKKMKGFVFKMTEDKAVLI